MESLNKFAMKCLTNLAASIYEERTWPDLRLKENNEESTIEEWLRRSPIGSGGCEPEGTPEDGAQNAHATVLLSLFL